MAHRPSKPLPPVPGSAPAAPCVRSELTSALAERRQLISSDQASHQDRRQVSSQARGAVSPPRYDKAVLPHRGAALCPRTESAVYPQTNGPVSPRGNGVVSPPRNASVSPQARGAVSPRHDAAVSPQARGAVSPRHGGTASPRRSPKEHRFSMPQPMPVLPGLPKKRFSAMELGEKPSPKTDRPIRQGPPAKPKPTTIAPKSPGRIPEQPGKAPSTSPLNVAPKPKKPPVTLKSTVPVKPERCKGSLPGSRSSEDFVKERKNLPPIPFQPPAAAVQKSFPLAQVSPPVERYPSEELYESYDDNNGIYEAPVDEEAELHASPLSTSVPVTSSLYHPMNMPQPEAISFGANGSGPLLFDSPTTTMTSPGGGGRGGPAKSISQSSSHGKLPVGPPAPKPSGKSVVSPPQVRTQPPPPAKKPKPGQTKPGQKIRDELARMQCFSEPNSPRTQRSGGAETRQPALNGMKAAAVHGSVDSLSSLATSDSQSRWSRLSNGGQDNSQRPQLPVPATPAGTKASAKTDDRCLTPPSIPRRTASNAGALMRRKESAVFRDELPAVGHGDSPRLTSPQESRGRLPQPPSGHEYPRSGTPDSGVCRSNSSPSDVYDDVVIITPHPEGDGPVRPPGVEDLCDDLTYSDATVVAAEVKKLRAEVVHNMPKRLVDRLGPRQSAVFASSASAEISSSPYQLPDRPTVSEEEYTHLHDAWSDAPGSTTDSFYELEDLEEFNELLSSYTDPTGNGGPQHEVDRHCRVATLKASRGYIVEASQGLDPPGDAPAELANNSTLRESDLYSDNGQDVYANFIKTGLNAVRFGKFPSYIQGRPRLSMRTASVGGAPGGNSAENRQYQYIQLIVIHEEIYNNTLRLLVERFAKARDFSPDLPQDLRVIDKITAKTLFSNIEALLAASTKLLSGLRRRLRSQNGDITTVSDLFNFMLCDSFNKLYLTYCTNFVYQTRKLDELTKDNSHFSRSLALVENDRSLGGQTLSSFISAPISYIAYLPKYLQVLTENLPPQAVTVELKAAEAAKKVGRWCDEAAQTVYRTEQLVRTEHELDFAKVKHIALVSQSRRLIRSGPVKLLGVTNTALHRQDAQLLVFNDLIMLAKPRGIISTIKLLRSDKTLRVIDWCERRQADVETDAADLMDFPEQEKTMRGGISRLRTHVRREAALDTRMAFKLMWETDGEPKEYLLEAFNTTDRERWLTALDNESSILGRAVESVYEDAEITHYEVTTEHVAKETDELNLVLGSTVVSRRKAADGWCFGEDLLTGRAGWFQLLYCNPA